MAGEAVDRRRASSAESPDAIKAGIVAMVNLVFDDTLPQRPKQ